MNNQSADLFKKFVVMLRDRGFDYCMFGSYALKCYIPTSQCTNDVNFLFHEFDKAIILPKVKALVKQNSWKLKSFAMGVRINHPDGDVYLDLHFASFDPYESAIELPNKLEAFGVRINVIKPEFMLWTYLKAYLEYAMDNRRESKMLLKKRFTEISALLDNDLVDLEKLVDWLNEDPFEAGELAILERILSARVKRR
jgi:hypothetical protein